ncbi:MAG: hypothetical protein ACE5HN_10430, partial [Nitrospiria bacterium]
KPSSRLKDKARGHKGDRGSLTWSVWRLMADNVVFSGELAVSNSTIAELEKNAMPSRILAIRWYTKN